MRDFSDDLKGLRVRLDEARGYLKIDANRSRLIELEAEVSRPDLWDDQDRARKVNSEYADVKGDVADFDGLAGDLEDVEVLHEMARDEDDASQEPEIEDAIGAIAAKLDGLELRSLFTGPHDEADAIVQINAKDGGVDAQDWSEMLLRMYTRWAERRGFEVDHRRVLRGHRSRDHVLRVHDQGSLRLRSDDGRTGHPSARADLAVRQPGPPPDEFCRRPGLAALGEPRHRSRRVRRADGGLPGVGCRRSARQQDLVRRAPDPRAHRVGVGIAGGAQPVAEPREGDESPEGDVRSQGRGGAGGRVGAASPAGRPRSAGAARSAATSSSRTRWSKTCAPSTRPATSAR